MGVFALLNLQSTREYFPKGQDLTDISQEHIQESFDELNVHVNASAIVRPMRSSIRNRCT